MSATPRNVSPSISRKPISQNSSGTNNASDIDQLLDLIDSQLAASKPPSQTTQSNNGSATSTPQAHPGAAPPQIASSSSYSNFSVSTGSKPLPDPSSAYASNPNPSRLATAAPQPSVSYVIPSSSNTDTINSYNASYQPHNNIPGSAQTPYYGSTSQYYATQNYPQSGNYYSPYPQYWQTTHNPYTSASGRPLPTPPGPNYNYGGVPTSYTQYHAYNTPQYPTVSPASGESLSYLSYNMPEPQTYVSPSPQYQSIPETEATLNDGRRPLPLPTQPGQQPTIVNNFSNPNAQPPKRRSSQSSKDPSLPGDDVYAAYPTEQRRPASLPSVPEKPRKETDPYTSQAIEARPSVGTPQKKDIFHGINGMMNPALLSNIALVFKAIIKLGTHVKGAIEYPDSFNGADAVNTILSILPTNTHRRLALSMARSLEAQLYFHSVDWSIVTVVRDNDDEVYTFLNPDPYSPSTWEWDEDFPTGVFPSVAKCYSPRCSTDGKGCYSRTCPNYVPNEEEAAKKSEPPLNRQFSTLSIVSDQSEPMWSNNRPPAPLQARTWTASVPKEISDKLDKEEQKRQEIIFETIYTEEDYVKDLNLLEELYVDGLRKASPPIIPPARVEMFIQDVFYNVLDIREHNQRMLERLRERQREGYVVEKIGDIFLQSALDFGNDYILYNGHFPLADSYLKAEKAKNPLFKSFLEQCSRRPEARKLDSRHFIQRPTTRLQRYTLLLEQILKHTADGHPDKGVLENAWKNIKELCKESDNKVHEAEKRLRIVELDRKLVMKTGETCPALKLLDPNRRLLFKGELQKRSDTGIEWLDLYVFLFDHYLVMTKPKKGNDGEVKYIISKKAIPLDMLVVDLSIEQPQSRSIHFPNLNVLGDGRRARTNSLGFQGYGPPMVTNLDGQDNQMHRQAVYPFTVIHIGRHGGTYQLFADSSNTRRVWKEKILEAQNKLQLSRSHQQVFELFTLNDATFGSHPAATNSGSSSWKGKVICSVPFVTPEKRHMVAIGTDEGVWMGLGGETNSFRNVLRINDVTQMAVLEEYGLFIVLAGKMLWAYSLEAMIPSSGNSSTTSNQASRHPQKVTQSTNVQYFGVGTITDKTLLVYMKRRGLESHFKVLEPVISPQNSTEKPRGGLGAISSRRFGIGRNEWFKEYKQLYIPSESYSVSFLRSKLCVVCTRGFEIVNLDTLLPTTIPDFTEPEFASIARQCEGSKPLGMFRLGDNEFLLCYDQIFFYVDRHGELSRPTSYQWEGTPEAVALQMPYVIAFDPSFIEIRHVQSGELVQVIPGKNMRCLNDNTTGRHAVHAVMQHPFTDTQYIFQLVLAENRRSNSIRGVSSNLA